MSVRWDAVVGRSRFWAEPPRPVAQTSAFVHQAGATFAAKVWLYGTLASGVVERPLVLQLAPRFSVGDVIAELGRRYGEEFLGRVMGADGRKFSHCRVFVDGLPAEDIEASVHDGRSPAQVEMILLTAAEGG